MLYKKPQNLKYLVKTQRDFNKLNKKLGKYSEEYQKLSSAIYSYKTLFIKKLLSYPSKRGVGKRVCKEKE